MGTGFYLIDNGGDRQYRIARRSGEQPSGVVVVHTAENVTDRIGDDAGAEAVARFIAGRTDFGSYHRLCDSDSTIPLAPWWYEVWQDTRTNGHAVGISAAVASRDWPQLGDRGDAIVLRMAAAARDFADWLHTTRGIVVPPRRISRAQALSRVPGFIGHGEIDTGRRTDPGAGFDWQLFLDAFAGASPTPIAPRPVTPTRKGDEDVTWFIRECYRRHLGRDGSPAEWAEHADRAIKRGETYAQIERVIRDSAEAHERFIVQQYETELGRVPSTGEVAHWVGTGLDRATIAAQIAGSEEAQQRRRR